MVILIFRFFRDFFGVVNLKKINEIKGKIKL